MIPGTKLPIKGGAERWRDKTLKNLLVGDEICTKITFFS